MKSGIWRDKPSIYTHMPSFVAKGSASASNAPVFGNIVGGTWVRRREGRKEEAWHASWLAIPQDPPPPSEPKLPGLWHLCTNWKSKTRKCGHLATGTWEVQHAVFGCEGVCGFLNKPRCILTDNFSATAHDVMRREIIDWQRRCCRHL